MYISIYKYICIHIYLLTSERVFHRNALYFIHSNKVRLFMVIAFYKEVAVATTKKYNSGEKIAFEHEF